MNFKIIDNNYYLYWQYAEIIGYEYQAKRYIEPKLNFVFEPKMMFFVWSNYEIMSNIFSNYWNLLISEILECFKKYFKITA